VARNYVEALTLLYHAKRARNSWLASVENDLQWFSTTANSLADYRGASLGTWINFLQAAPKQTMQLLYKIAMEATAEACKTLHCANNNPDNVMQMGTDTYMCEQCHTSYDTYQQYAVHAAHKHGCRRTARRYAKSNICMICLQAFSSRSKVVDHISEKGEVCALNLAMFGTPMSLEQTAELDAHDHATESTTRRTGRRHNYSPTMAKQAYGPVRPICVPNGHSRQSRRNPLRNALQVADEIEVADHSWRRTYTD
jgi:hypothetical protein